MDVFTVGLKNSYAVHPALKHNRREGAPPTITSWRGANLDVCSEHMDVLTALLKIAARFAPRIGSEP